MTPVDKIDSLIVVTFDALGRPVVSQSVSGNGVEPRLLLDNDGDGIFESEKIVSDKLNTCHGLFYASRTTLYANCRAVMPATRHRPVAGAAAVRRCATPAGAGRRHRSAAAPPRSKPAHRRCSKAAAPPVQQQAAGQPAARRAAGWRRPRRAGGGNQPDPGIAGLYKLEDINGDDVMDTIERIHRYTSAGMGDHGPHAVHRAPDGSIAFLVGNNTYVGSPPPQGSPVSDDVVDKAKSPNWNNLKERQFLPG